MDKNINNKMENLENNKLIAEFMGWTLDDKDINSYRKLNNNVFKYSLLSNFKYHTDWNWLMEVVEKIRVTEKCNDFNINYSCDVKIECEGYDKVFEIYTSNTINTLQAVYNACVEFIKWDSENK
jgi:hypothetical protein